MEFYILSGPTGAGIESVAEPVAEPVTEPVTEPVVELDHPCSLCALREHLTTLINNQYFDGISPPIEL